MEMNETCEKFIHNLGEFISNLQARYITRRISFSDREMAENFYSLGYVETVSQQDEIHSNKLVGGSVMVGVGGGEAFLIENGINLSSIDLNEEKYETLEMQLKHIPRRNASLIRKNKFPHANIQVKHVSKQRFKSIIEPRKFFQPYKIIGCEGEENSEFKHPLGNQFEKIINFFSILKKIFLIKVSPFRL